MFIGIDKKKGMAGMPEGELPDASFEPERDDLGPILCSGREETRLKALAAVAGMAGQPAEVDLRELAGKLLESGKAFAVAKNLCVFEDILDEDMALKLIEAGKGDQVAKEFEKFIDADADKVAGVLVESGCAGDLMRYFEKFTGADGIKAAEAILERGKKAEILALSRNLDKFTGLGKEHLMKLMESNAKGAARNAAKSLQVFAGLDAEVADMLLKKNRGEELAQHLPDFTGTDTSKIMADLIETGKGAAVAKYLENFPDIAHSDVASRLLVAGEGEAVAEHLPKFKGVNHMTLALMLVDEGAGEAVAGYLENFKVTSHKEIAQKLIEAEEGENLAKYLEKFKGLDHKDIVDRLIETGQAECVARHFKNFKDLPQDATIHRLIERGAGKVILAHPNNFHELDDPETLIKLIRHGCAGEVLSRPWDFKKLYERPVILALLEKEHYNPVAEMLNSSNARAYDCRDVVMPLIASNHGWVLLKRTIDLDVIHEKDIALSLVKNGLGSDFIPKLRPDCDQEVIITLVDYGLAGPLLKHIAVPGAKRTVDRYKVIEALQEKGHEGHFASLVMSVVEEFKKDNAGVRRIK